MLSSHRLKLLDPIKRWLGFAAAIGLATNLLMLATPIYMMQIFDRVLTSGNPNTLIMLTLITVALVAANSALDLIRGRVMTRSGFLLESTLAPKVLAKVHDFRIDRSHQAGAENVRDVGTLRNYLSSPHPLAIFDAPWAIVFTLLIAMFSWVLGVITAVGILILAILALAEERITYPRFTRANRSSSLAQETAITSVSNAEVIHALGMKPALLMNWQKLSSSAMAETRLAQDSAQRFSSVAKTVRTLIQVAMLGAGAYLVIHEGLSSGIMIAATIIVGRAIGPVEQLISGWKTLIEARNAYARLAILLPEGHASAGTKTELPPINGEIRLERLAFAFRPGHAVFAGVSLLMRPGEVVGFFGPSGSGKSTLARVILGLMPPLQGIVTFDGYEVSQFNRDTLGKQLGYLPQDVELFSGTIAQNIARMDDPRGHDAEINRVIEQVGLKPVIALLPDGLDTQLAGGGANLSGGQRQLVGLARALFGSPKLLVLDEPDANLDQQGRQRVAELIEEFKASRTTTIIVISHNPILVDRMDRLILVQNGSIQHLEKQSGSAKPPLRPIASV